MEDATAKTFPLKALVIAPQPFFSPRGTPFSVYYRTLITAELGVQVDLLTYGQGQDVDIPGVRLIRIPGFKFLGPVKVGPSGLKLFLDVILVFWTLGLLLRHRYDFVQVHEEAVFFSTYLKKIFGFKLVYDMHSSLPQQLTNFQFTNSRWLIGLFKKMEETSLKKAEAVITICPDLKDYVNRIISNPRKHFLIENSIFDEIRLGPDRSTAGNPGAGEELKPIPEGRAAVVYAGTLESYQGIDLLIDAFALVVREDKRAYLVIVGGTAEQVARYRTLAGERGIENDSLFTGRVSQKMAKAYTGLAQVLVSPRNRGTNTPLKVYEHLQSGIPLVATEIYSHTQVLTPEVAFLAKPEPCPFAQAILAALKDDQPCREKTTRARKLYAAQYARPVYKDKIRQVLEYLRSCAA